jgi:hypothetical protein
MKLKNIYETHQEDVKVPVGKRYRNMESKQVEQIATTERQHFIKGQKQDVSSLLKSQDDGLQAKVIPVNKKPTGIKTFKHDSSGSRLGFGEVETKPPPQRTSSNFWGDEGKNRSPIRNTKTWTTSKEFSFGS